jgi:acetyl-CoA C-acetyltransferase
VNEVAIIGVGLHPFGRFPGKSALEMGADAIRFACNDAGVDWADVQFAVGGSSEVDFPDAVLSLVGLTGIPFMDVYNGCATAATALGSTADGICSGRYDIGVAVGMDKHIPGAFTGDPEIIGIPTWYGEVGQFITTKFFGMKINRYMHEYGISQEALALVAAKGYGNGARNPNAFRRKPLTVEQILDSQMLNYPLTQYMFCAPDEGAAAAVLCRADLAHRYTSKPIYLRATALRTRKYGAYEVHATWAAVDEEPAPTVFASRAAYEMAGIGPEDVDVVQLQDTDAGAEIMHMAENGFCRDGERRSSSRKVRPRSTGRSRSTLTGG